MGLISASSRTLTRTIGDVEVVFAKLTYRDKAAILAAEMTRRKAVLVAHAKQYGEPIPLEQLKAIDAFADDDEAFVRFCNDNEKDGDHSGPRAVGNQLTI